MGTLADTDRENSSKLLDKNGLTERGKAYSNLTFAGDRNALVVHDSSTERNTISGYSSLAGVWLNEGGSFNVTKQMDVLVSSNTHFSLTAALWANAYKGALDFMKQGRIDFKATSGRSRIWAWSHDHAEQEDHTATDLLGYAHPAGDLETAVMVDHGATATIVDGEHGWLDIRGDLMAGAAGLPGDPDLTNGDKYEGSYSHTVTRVKDVTDDKDPHDYEGVVTHSNITLTLTNPNSILIGNVYERHRRNEEEVGWYGCFAGNKENTPALTNVMRKQAAGTLGGQVDLTISNGAHWFPMQGWLGWDRDLEPQGTVNADPKVAYKADQANLHVWDETQGQWTVVNTLGNDADLAKVRPDTQKTERETSPGLLYEPKIDNPQRNVDNGVVNLTLAGGVMDLRFLRTDYEDFVGDNLAENAEPQADESFDVLADFDAHQAWFLDHAEDGVRSMRIQNLNGIGNAHRGTVRMYAKDAQNHDLLIVDKVESVEPMTLNLDFWNGTPDVLAGDPSTYIHVARVPENVTITAVRTPRQGEVGHYEARVERDQKTENGPGAWTEAQKVDWHQSLENWFITDDNMPDAPNPDVVASTTVGLDLAYMMAADLERLSDRRGDMRTSKDGSLWIRAHRTRSAYNGTDLEGDFVQIGTDSHVAHDGAVELRTVAFDYLDADADYDALSEQGDASRWRLSLYDTWFFDSGAYVDAHLHAGRYDTEIDGVWAHPSQTAYAVSYDADFWAYGLSLESGHRFESDARWFIEPQLQLAYTYVEGVDYDTSRGWEGRQEDMQSLIGRAGVRIGKTLMTDTSALTFAVTGDVLNEWLGDREVNVRGTDKAYHWETDGSSTWFEAGFGLTLQTERGHFGYANVRRVFGQDNGWDDTWSLNAGVSFAF